MSRGLIDRVLTQLIKGTTAKEVALPFTPPSNGLLLVLLRTLSTARTYEIYANATPGICDAYLQSGCYTTGVMFVTKGNQVSVTGTSGHLSGHQYWFVPLNISGADAP